MTVDASPGTLQQAGNKHTCTAVCSLSTLLTWAIPYICHAVLWRAMLCCDLLLCTGLEDGARLPEPVQVDPGAAEHTALAANLAKLPNSLTAALDAWQDDKKLQVSTERG